MSQDSLRPGVSSQDAAQPSTLAPASFASATAKYRHPGILALIGDLGPLICGGVALILGAWQISRLSFTQDEAATISVIRRPFGSMLALLGHIDAVHGAYYLIMHLVVKLGPSEVILRAPSVLAMAGAASLTALIGAKVAGKATGLAAGLIFSLTWLTTEYADDARPFAMATFLAVLASYRFVVYLLTGTRRDAGWYAAVLAVCGLMNVFALLVATAHLVTLLASPVARARLPRYGAALAAVAVLVSPLAWLAATQVSQVGWEQRPRPAVSLGILAALVVTAAVSFALARPGRSLQVARPAEAAFGPEPLIRLSAPWLVIPIALLLGASQLTVAHSPGQSPTADAGIWEPRYLLFCLPAAALLIVALVSRLPRRAAVAAATAVVVVAAASQPLARPAISPDDLRSVSALIGRQSRPGDAIIFPDIAKRLIEDAYPAGFSRVRDIGLDTSAAARNSLYGLNVSAPVLRSRLAHVQRLWIVVFPTESPGAHYQNFCLLRSWRFPLNTVLLYRRCAG